MIKKEVLRNGQEVTIKNCTVKDIDAFLSLQEEVIASLTNNDFFQSLSREEYSHILNGHGQVIGAFSDQELVAFRALLIPDIDDPEHLGKDAGLDNKALHDVIYSEISSVKPSFRGNRLQKILGEIILGQIDPQQFRYICATVAPFNIASLLDKFSHDLHIVALEEKYGGRLRYIFMKDCKAEPKEPTESILVQMGEIKEQQALLEKGWYGTSIVEKNKEWFVEYQR